VSARLLDLGCYEVSLGDTIGVANPRQVRDVLARVLRELSIPEIAVHFHDTRGTALANILIAIAEKPVFFTIIAISVPQQLTSLYLQNVHHLSIQQIGIMGTIASIGTAIIMFSLGNLRVSTGMLIGQLLLAGFALLMWRGQSAIAYFVGYFFVGGYQLYRSMALAFSRSLVKVGDTERRLIVQLCLRSNPPVSVRQSHPPGMRQRGT
jgi:hypothetical protein